MAWINHGLLYATLTRARPKRSDAAAQKEDGSAQESQRSKGGEPVGKAAA
jgi:hypothetical protein